jgi:hypothetical protein
MFNTRWLSETLWVPGLTLSLIAGATVLVGDTAQAQSVVIEGATSVRVGQAGGNIRSSRRQPSHQQENNRIEGSTLVNPVLINPTIEGSILINPVIIEPEHDSTTRRAGRGSVHFGNDNPACSAFQSIRVACR